MIKLVLTRVDSRLVHGQILEDWVPSTGADLIIVANDEVAADPLQTTIVEMCACTGEVTVRVSPLSGVAGLLASPPGGARSAILLVRDVEDAARLWDLGIRFVALNLGNVHAHDGSRQVSRSVSLSSHDLEVLRRLERDGVAVGIQAVSRDRLQPLADAV